MAVSAKQISLPASPQALSVSELIQTYGCDPEQGLSEKQARLRRKRFGNNNLQGERELRFSDSLKSRFKGLTDLFLLLSMLLFYLFEQKPIYLVGFLGSVLLIVLSALAESAAVKLMNTPGKYAAFSVRVIRDGNERVIDSRLLVPGDLILLEKGCLIPADVRILTDSGMLYALETPVSGVRSGVRKTSRIIGKEDEAVCENMLYAGTILTEGECRALVCRTGKLTLTRQIHTRRTDPLPQLLKRVREFGRITSLAGLLACPVLLLIGLLRGVSLSDLFLLSAVIGASSLCDSALSLACVSFTRGVQDMAKDKLIVRNPDKVARLACTGTVMCTKELMFPPKKIRLLSVYASGRLFRTDAPPNTAVQSLLKLSLVCSDHPKAYRPYEQGILQYLTDAAVPLSDLQDTWFRMDTERNAAGETVGVLSLHNDHNTVVVKGAPENILSRCAGYEQDGKEYRLNDSARRNILQACEAASKENAYLVAIASGITREDSLRAPGAEKHLIFRGFVSFRLSMEVDVANAVYRCNSAGIEAVVSTKDPYYTAASIGRSTGLIEHEGQMISSPEIKALERGMFVLNAPKYKLFLDPEPDQWLDVLLLRKQSGKTVAAAASKEEELFLLREADVSLVPVRSPDALRAGADFLLAESGFHVPANGITDARALCFRLRWLMQYLTSGVCTLFVAALLSLIGGVPMPFGVSEALFGGVFLNLVLAGILALLPVDRKLLGEELPDPRARMRLRELLLPFGYAFGSGGCLFGLMLLTGNPSCALPCFLLSQFFYACGCLWKGGVWRRKRFGYRLLWAAFLPLGLTVAGLVLIPGLNEALGFSPLTWQQALWSVAFPAVWQLLIQGILYVIPHLKKRKHNTTKGAIKL